VVNVSYYSTAGGYNSTSCGLSPCSVGSCGAGSYLYGCGGMSQGACATCNNVN
jgi:hypothetical protein